MISDKPKVRKFRIKIEGVGTYDKDKPADNLLQEIVAQFFDKKPEDLENGNSLIDLLTQELTNHNPYKVKSSFNFRSFEFLGNDIDPDDGNPI